VTDERKKRPGTQSDEDRALAELARRRSGNTPVGGTPTVPTNEFNQGDEDFTPVGKVIDRIEEVMMLDERDRMLLRLFWQHTANMEMRSRKRSDSQDTSALAKRIDELENFRTDVTGADGTNGKIGNLRKQLDSALARAWWLVTVLVGGIGAAAIKLIIVGQAYGELKQSVDNNARQIQLIERATFLKSIPGLTPEKEPNTP
jgi:hypothetical protein